MMNIPLLNFVLYFGLAAACWLAGVALYAVCTPYNELRLIRAGNVAAAISLGGTALGLALPLGSLAVHAVSLIDFVTWAGVAVVVQLLAWLLVARVALPDIRTKLPEGSLAHALTLAAVSLAVGILNATSLSY